MAQRTAEDLQNLLDFDRLALEAFENPTHPIPEEDKVRLFDVAIRTYLATLTASENLIGVDPHNVLKGCVERSAARVK